MGRAGNPRAATTPPNGAWTVHRWRGAQHSFSQELSKVIGEVEPNILKSGDIQAQIEVGLKNAALGRLRVEDANGDLTIKRSKSQPTIWEIPRKVVRHEVRIYVSDPESGPVDIVALLVHVKDVAGLAWDVINRRQNEKMRLAAERYVSNEGTFWGHQEGWCAWCVTP